MAHVVKTTFAHHSEDGGIIWVLADSPTEAIPGQKRLRMVAEDAFDPGTPERAYVEQYGIIVDPSNLRDKLDSEIDTYRQWALHADADGAWATRALGGDVITAKRVSELYDLIDEHEED